jgi:myosin heavy subunit
VFPCLFLIFPYFLLSVPKGAVESDLIKARDNDIDADTDDIQYLKHINEPEVIQLLQLRYHQGLIFTFSGGVLMYLNPFHQVTVSPASHSALEQFVRKIMIGLSNRSSGKTATPKQSGIARRKSQYVMTKAVDNITCKDSIIISGESGSGKSECYKMILMSLAETATNIDQNVLEDLKNKSVLFDVGTPQSPQLKLSRTFSQRMSGRTNPLPPPPAARLGSKSKSLGSTSKSLGSRSKSLDRATTSAPFVNFKFPSVDSGEGYKEEDDGENSSTDSPTPEMVVTSAHAELVEKVLLSNRILESFGNATTLRTFDSSRFAKLVEFIIKPKGITSVSTRNQSQYRSMRSMESITSQLLNRLQGGEIIGATIKTYLLESWRTSTQQKKEKNFNIFYELLSGWSSEERERFSLLGNYTQYFYTSQGNFVYSDELEQEDAQKFYELNDAFMSLNFSFETVSAIYETIAGIIMMGEVYFDDNLELVFTEKYLSIEGNKNYDPLSTAADLFGVEAKTLKTLLTSKTLVTPNGDVIQLNLNKEQSQVARDSIVKQIYKYMFDYIVEEINWKLEVLSNKIKEEVDGRENSAKKKKLSPNPNTNEYNDLRSLLILDIFGFDALDKNSINQLCLNYANDAMQDQFTQFVFKSEMEEYTREGLSFSRIDLSVKDPTSLVANIFKTLDDQCRLPHPTDKRFLAVVYKEYESHPLFSVSKKQSGRNQFSIKHIAGEVEYTADDFIEKNMDNTPPGAGKVLSTSSNSLLSSIYSQILSVEQTAQNSAANGNQLTGRTGVKERQLMSKNLTLTSYFKMELNILLQEIETTKKHYIRCIKPTEQEWISSHFHEKNYWFSQGKVAEQLRYGGIMEVFRFTKAKLKYLEFFNRFRVIAAAIFKDTDLPYHIYDGIDVSTDEFDEDLSGSSTKELVLHRKMRAQTAKLRTIHTEQEIRDYCLRLIQLFSIVDQEKSGEVKETVSSSNQPFKSNNTGGPVAMNSNRIKDQIKANKNKRVSLLLSPEEQAQQASNAENLISMMPFTRPALKKSFSRRSGAANPLKFPHSAVGQPFVTPESKKTLRGPVPSVYKMVNGNILNFDVDVFLAADGIISTKHILLGKTKVFMPLQEHDYLEVCRTSCIYHLTKLIYECYLTYKLHKDFTEKRSAARLLQKKFRNHRARIIRAARLRSVVRLQRIFRRRRFVKKIVMIQTHYRMHFSMNIRKLLIQQRKELDETYGVFLTARDMRLRRRGLLHSACVVMTNKQQGITETMKDNPFVATKEIVIPTLERRTAIYNYQEDCLIREITSLKPDPNILMAPLRDRKAATFLSDQEEDEDEDSDEENAEANEIFRHLVKKEIPSSSSAVDSGHQPMKYNQILQYFELCLKAFPVKLAPAIYPLQVITSINQIKTKAHVYAKAFVPAGKLLKGEALVNFSFIGKYMGLTAWKITTQPTENTMIPQLKLTHEHALFEFIHKVMKKLDSFQEFITACVDYNAKYLEQLQPALPSSPIQSPKGFNFVSGWMPVKLEIPNRNKIITKIKKLNQLLNELVFTVSEMKFYYSNYIRYFITEYGEKSMFSKAFVASSSYIKYLFSLLRIVKLEKKYDSNMSTERDQLISDYDSWNQKHSSKTSAFPLILEWAEEKLADKMKGTLKSATSMIKLKEAEELNKLKARFLSNENGTMKKLAEVEESKQKINADNLRIIEHSGFTYQFMPVYPVIDHAINSFASLLLGDIPKLKQLCKLTGHRHYLGQTAYYSVASSGNNENFFQIVSSDGSNRLHKQSLMDVLYNPVSVEQLESLSFSSMLITCCLFGLLNLQPNHLMVHYDFFQNQTNADGSSNLPTNLAMIGSSLLTPAEMMRNIKLTSVNGDAHVYSRFLSYKNNSVMNKVVHYQNLNVLFFLPQMDEPIHPLMKQLLLFSSPFALEEMMIIWLRDLYEENERNQRLLIEKKKLRRNQKEKSANRRPEEFNEADLDNLVIPLQIPKGSVCELFKRFKHLKKFLTEFRSNEPDKDIDKSMDESTDETDGKPRRRQSMSSKLQNSTHDSPTLSAIFHEFYPYLADFYQEIRLRSDFKEGITIDGVVSYAYAYHHTLNRLHSRHEKQKAKELKVQQQKEIEQRSKQYNHHRYTHQHQHFASPLSNHKQHSSPGIAADHRSPEDTKDARRKHNHHHGISTVISQFLLRTKTTDSEDPTNTTPSTTGAGNNTNNKTDFNGSFWQNVAYIEGADDLLDDQEEKDKQSNKSHFLRLKKKKDTSPKKDRKKGLTITTSPATEAKSKASPGSPGRTKSVTSFNFDDVYEQAKDEDGLYTAMDGNSALFLSSTKPAPSAFDFGDVYDKKDSLLNMAKSIFGESRTPPARNDSQFSYGDAFDLKSQFSMNSEALQQQLNAPAVDRTQSTQSIRIDLDDIYGANRSKSVDYGEERGIYPVDEEGEEEDEREEDVVTELNTNINSRRYGHSSSLFSSSNNNNIITPIKCDYLSQDLDQLWKKFCQQKVQ